MSKRDERDEPRVISAQNSPTCCVFAVETVFSVRVCVAVRARQRVSVFVCPH